MSQAQQVHNLQPSGPKKAVKDFVTSSKNLLNSQNGMFILVNNDIGSSKIITKTVKTKALTTGLGISKKQKCLIDYSLIYS
jgi:hypothetical protein